MQPRLSAWIPAVVALGLGSGCGEWVETSGPDRLESQASIGSPAPQAAPASSGENAAKRSRTSGARKLRTFRFDYAARVHGLPAGSRVQIWIPVPPSNEYQSVTRVAASLPAEASEGREARFGNQMLHLATTAPAQGELSLSIGHRVERYEVRGLEEKDADARLSEADRREFLAANANVPLGGAPLRLLEGRNLPENNPLGLGRALYNFVDDHVRYDKSKSGYGQGDVLWVCDSRFGNCTDFHSLFLSVARSKGLPSRFEMGFPVPPERGQGTIGGYHCWAYFFVDGHGWVPVDISEADKLPHMKDYFFGNLTEDRVTFTTGRDLVLVPPQNGPPLNYFIYPYVEVDGAPWPADRIERRFAYQDL